MSKKFNLYIGKSGQLAAMSEFLARGWNVATPEVDILIIDRETLYQFHQTQKIGSLSHGNLVLYLSFKNKKATCSKADFTPFVSNFEDFPIISH